MLRYNVWERDYLVRTDQMHRTFSSLGALVQFLNDSLQFSLGPVRALPTAQPLQIRIVYSPEPLSDIQQNRLNRWLTTAANGPRSPDKESSFSIDLTGLLSLFLGKPQSKSIVFSQSRVFTIAQLMNQIPPEPSQDAGKKP